MPHATRCFFFFELRSPNPLRRSRDFDRSIDRFKNQAGRLKVKLCTAFNESACISHGAKSQGAFDTPCSVGKKKSNHKQFSDALFLFDIPKLWLATLMLDICFCNAVFSSLSARPSPINLGRVADLVLYLGFHSTYARTLRVTKSVTPSSSGRRRSRLGARKGQL